jgi:hypothetical protein
MHRPPYSVVFAAVLVLAAASAVLGQNSGKAANFQEFDNPAPPSVTRNSYATEADALFPAAVRKAEPASAFTPYGPASVRPAPKGSRAGRPRFDPRARIAYPTGGTTLSEVTQGFKGILAALAPSKEDLRRALVAVTSPPDSPSGRPGPHWKHSPQWVLR